MKRMILAIFAAVLLSGVAAADSKLILLTDDIPRNLGQFELSTDEKTLYFGGSGEFLGLDQQANFVRRVPGANATKELIQRPDGWFFAFNSHAGGHIALYRPDGTEAKKIVTRGGGDRAHLKGDMTGWTSPTGGAVDFQNKLIFALDLSMPPRGKPSPYWSRIAIFDYDGKFVGDINFYDGRQADADDAKRTWYNDVEVDPQRKRVYASSDRYKKILVFDYDGKKLAELEGDGGIAVFPDGRIAAGKGSMIFIYNPDFTQAAQINAGMGITDLETDSQGCLYASNQYDPTIAFMKWQPDLKTSEAFGPSYQRIDVNYGSRTGTAGRLYEILAKVSGRPEPKNVDNWQVLARPANGSDLQWEKLEAAYKDEKLFVEVPEGYRGIYEVAVKWGNGPIAWADRSGDLYVQQNFSFLPEGADKSLSVITATGRRAYQTGESIGIQLIRREKDLGLPVNVTVELAKDGEVVARLMNVESTGDDAFRIDGSYTARLVPGEYQLSAKAVGYQTYTLGIDLVQAAEESPMQRVLYHEFGGSAMEAGSLADNAEYKDFARNYAKAVNRMGFNRETDRMVGKTGGGPNGWKMTGAPASISDPGFAPAEFFRSPDGSWFSEFYHDLATKYGIRLDSQLVGHCGSVIVADSEFQENVPLLQRYAQWLSTYPSFYGYNYNDELFYGAYNPNWLEPQKNAMKDIREEILPAQLKAQGEDRKPLEAEVRLYALDQMYSRFNKAVKLADPDANLTATPMWQYPACEGSYAPTIYKSMSETYSHYLSEGYQFPWYPAHSLEILKRPGLPSVAVFDNGYGGGTADVYLKSSMQMLGRGTQAVGVEHTAPFVDYRGVDALRTANELAKVYGPVFADVKPDNAGTILYSITQDLTERRHHFGTPHWERGFALQGAGLMCGVPMDFVYEEDVRAGLLLENGKPRTPMLFLLGVTVELPKDVRDAILAYEKAGGRVFLDTASADFPGAQQLGFDSFAIKEVMSRAFDADTVVPEWAPVMEDLANKLQAAVKQYVPYPVSTDDPWVGKNLFDGGDARYVMLSTEMSPYPWDCGEVWALGAMYGKGDYHWRPKTITLTLPTANGTIYDVFAKKIVKPVVADGKARVEVDLTLLPGRLYACVPAPLAAPVLKTAQQGSKLLYQVQIASQNGQAIKAQVPVRIRLASADQTAAEFYRSTRLDGSLGGSLDVPINSGVWSLEVTELLGGKASAARVNNDADAVPAFLRTANAAEIDRKAQITELLKMAREQGGITLHMQNNELPEVQVGAIRSALADKNVSLKVVDQLPNQATPGVYIAADTLHGDAPNEPILRSAWSHGIFGIKPTKHIPGPGRGFVTALFAPRGYQEHAIALLGSDTDGLVNAAEAFVKWIITPPKAIEEAGPEPPYAVTGAPVQAAALPQLDNMVGIRLSNVAVNADGSRLVVSAETFHKNVALLADNGANAVLMKAVRIGQSDKTRDLFISRDGTKFGLNARVINSYGEGFHLLSANSNAQTAFGVYGDTERYFRRFGVSADGNVVVTGGRYGVVCWKRNGNKWQQAWSLDYWKQFDNLEWPVTDWGERIPQFHAVVPDGADYALVLFGEFAANGWISDKDQGDVWLAALSLKDGSELWRFNVPIADKRLLPELHTSPDGSRVVLEVDVSKSPRKFYCLNNGKLLGSYQTGVKPITVQISGVTGWAAAAYDGRLLEIRDAAGQLVYNRLWPNQPFSLAFAQDGKSLIVSDDSGRLTCISPEGMQLWAVDLPVTAHVTSWKNRIYAACWDGHLRSFNADGSPRWDVDLTPAMVEKHAMAELAKAVDNPDNVTVYTAEGKSPATSTVPAGQNLLANGKAALKVGGTPGWKSGGRVQVTAEQLTNGEVDDVDTPWLSIPEVFWTSNGGRQVWMEISFKEPTDVKALTVYENPNHPESFPKESVIQVWNEETQHWDTARFGIFLKGSVNTYSLNLENVTKLRYLPWSSYFTNFYTSEIEVR